MFSTRVPRSLVLNRLAEALATRRRAGLPVIDLTESNPTRAGFEYPRDLLACLADPRGLTYAPAPLGLVEARQAIAGDYARRGIGVEAERIVLTASTSEAYSLLFKLLANPDDDVLVPRPSYPLFELLTSLDGVTARPYDLDYHGRWSIDFASIERALTPRTRALLLVSPNNPTGSFVTGEELERLRAICRPLELPLIVDEVFADYSLEAGVDEDRLSPLMREDLLTFSLGGLSKSIGLPQVKLGWIAVGGPKPMASDALNRLEIVCDTYLSVATPVQLAAAELMARGSSVRAQISARIVTNYSWLKQRGEQAPS